MRTKEKIGDTYSERFKSKCEDCGHHSDSECAYSGMQVADILFAVQRYFRHDVPGPTDIPCPIFADLKEIFDDERKQVPMKMALEKARHELGPKTLTGKKEEGG